MKKFTKVVACLIAAVMCFALVAVGSVASTSNAAGSGAEASSIATPSKLALSGNTEAAGKDLAAGIRIAYIPISTAGITNKMFELALNDVIGAYPNTSVDFFDPAYNNETQITMFNSAISEGYDLIICECGDPIALSTPVTNAEAAGIPVITLNIGTEAVHSLHLACDDYNSGYAVVKSLVEEFGADAGFTVAIIDTPAAMAANNPQSVGMMDALGELSNWEVVAHQNVDNFSQEGANTAMRDILTKFDDLDLILSCHDDLTAGILQALEASGRDDGSIILTGYMGNPMTFNAMMNNPDILYSMPVIDYYNEYATAVSAGLFMVQCGYTAVNAGLEKTPELLLTPTVTNGENVLEVYGASRWGWITD